MQSEWRPTRAFADKAGNTITEAKPRWLTIEDEKVNHVWQCKKCGKIVEVAPTFYEENGNPDCCETQMTYVHTLIQS